MPSGLGAVTAALARAGCGPALPPAMLAKLDAANTPAPQSTDASRQTIIVLPDRGSPSKKSKAHAERPVTAQPATKRWRATVHLVHHNGPPTAARQIYAACDASICALDPCARKENSTSGCRGTRCHYTHYCHCDATVGSHQNCQDVPARCSLRVVWLVTRFARTSRPQ